MNTISDDKKYSSIHYNSYLQLDKILSAQELRSLEVGDQLAHDEMLFIITHQVYELWFKQINFELKSIMDDFKGDNVNEKNMGVAVSRIDRINEILKLLVQQIAIIETMTPLDFLDFRNYLFPASGFQSFQFREFEVLLGLKDAKRFTYNDKPYTVVFDQAKKDTLGELENAKSLFQLVENWLERTPFLKISEFNFVEEYRKSVENMLDREKKAIQNTEVLSDEFKEMRLRMLGDTRTYFANILDEKYHESLIAEGKMTLSYPATVASLFISLYRDEPILHLPFKLISGLVELDDHLTTWRYRHAQMVMRMLGKKVGTGGSSGHEYLSETAARHYIFRDFHNVSTLLIPRSELPTLPPILHEKLGFLYSKNNV
ncbi:MAG: tryptophan 2,3-dioxygenase family protein [Saprospiraceae bacterium]